MQNDESPSSEAWPESSPSTAKSTERHEPLPLTSEADLVNPMYSAREVMRRGSFACAPRDPLRRAAELLLESGWNVVPVLEHGRVVGAVSAHEIAVAVGRSGLGEVGARRSRAVMTSPAPWVDGDTSITKVLRRMGQCGTPTVFVLEHRGHVTGVIDLLDLLPLLTLRGLRDTLESVSLGGAPRASRGRER